VIGVNVGIDGVLDLQIEFAQQGGVSVVLLKDGIDDHGLAAGLTAKDIGIG
jgi:hypothetical protein